MNEAVSTNPKGRVRIYACGGTAINIIGALKTQTINRDVIADFDIVLVDTSPANLRKHQHEAACYLVENLQGDELDGSGKYRGENIDPIRERVKPILQAHRTGDLNILLSSGAGGSGSVIANLLGKELAARGELFVALVVGSTSSKLEAQNTLNTIKSYEAAAKEYSVPVVMSYLQNSPNLPRSAVDKRMISTITFLGILFSRRNHELDSKDLQHWLQYGQPITSFPPRLSMLTVLWHQAGDAQLKTDMSQLGNIITVATLAPEGVDTDLPVPPEYQTVGILPSIKTVDEQVDGKVINYIISDGVIGQIHKDLDLFLKDMAATSDARTLRPEMTSSGDSTVGGVYI